MALIENIQREDLNPWKKPRASIASSRNSA
jgi:ParB-like chromosome segregation protein Spo0J